MLQIANPLPPSEGQPQLQAIVTGMRAAQAIEFTFVYGDPDLSVELVLPVDAFREFCRENGCIIAASDDRLRASMKRLLSPIKVAAFLPIGTTESNA